MSRVNKAKSGRAKKSERLKAVPIESLEEQPFEAQQSKEKPSVKKFFRNKWFILGVSLLNAAYTACLCVFAYWVFFYKIEYTDAIKFAAVYSVFSVVIGLLMYYTRKSPVTALLCMANVVIFFPILLMDWGNWGFVVPAAVITLFGFFCCKMSDTFKTVLGTVFLLMYILGGIAFFLITNVFMTSTAHTVIGEGTSPSGDFRYYIVNQPNNASGKTIVYIKPNMMDVDTGFFRLNTTIRRLIMQTNNPSVNNPAVVECEWKGTRLHINGEEYFNESNFVTLDRGERFYDFSTGNWTHTYLNVDYPFIEIIHSVTEIITNRLAERDETDDE